MGLNIRPCCCGGCTSCSNSDVTGRTITITFSGLVNGAGAFTGCNSCASVFNSTFVTATGGLISGNTAQCEWFYNSSASVCTNLNNPPFSSVVGFRIDVQIRYVAGGAQTQIDVILLIIYSGFPAGSPVAQYRKLIGGYIDCTMFTSQNIPLQNNFGNTLCIDTSSTCTMTIN